MSQDIKTLELAKIYENQGYFKDAFEIYSFLDSSNTSIEIKAGLKRMGKKITQEKDQEILPEKTISRLFEKWLLLIILKQRLANFNKIKSRLL
ncbi:MAG: hypothetical protein KKE44_07335 [Proteobacteria bacterium]|nr:hypothetical protein [Pseudomonadota bacterium]MBU1582542.1 hypothetical protein [Pseudomonadota bacterium]MBU2454401.1 hypothetical protein [Pseudomonadota bacterium]MBU2628982.1 hypothetical protein [Pseudomonadota bacterium]